MTGNEVETNCQVLTLVGPVFARDDSLIPQGLFSPFLLPTLVHTDLSQEKTALERVGGPDAVFLLSSSTAHFLLHPPNVCAHICMDERGGEQFIMG